MAEKWPVRISLALVKLAQKINEEHKAIIEVRNDLIKKYGEIDETTKQPTIKAISPNWPEFAKEHDELMKMEADIDVTPIKLPEMVAATCDKCNHNMDRQCVIEPSILFILAKFLEV